MPRRNDAINLSIQLTPEQHAALEADSIKANLKLSAYVRRVLAANVPGFADTIEKRERRDKKSSRQQVI